MTFEHSTLGDICRFIDYRGKTPEKTTAGIPLITAKIVKNGFIQHPEEFIAEESYDAWMRRGIPRRGSIIMTTEAPLGEVARIDTDARLAFAQRIIILEPDESRLNSQYLYYAMRDTALMGRIKARATGTTVTGIKAAELKKVIVDFPDLETQQKIGEILGSIDRKIQNNQQENDNLEQQALALFRHYFMDFEPYGGSAPSNWAEVSLDDVCVRITDGSHYSPADAPDTPYRMYSVKDMETYGFNSSSCKHITTEEFQKMLKNDCVPRLNDILVAKDGSYLKEIFICSEEKDEAILSSIAIFRPNAEVIMPEILLYLLKQPSVRKDVGDNYVSGSALPRIVLKDFKKYSFLLPPMTEQLRIGSVLHAIRMKTKANIDEIQKLTDLRECLLPRLMSREIDVSCINL